LAGVGLVCVLGVFAGIYAVRPGHQDRAAGPAVPEVDFGPEGNATSIPSPPPNFDPLMQLSEGSGPAGGEVSLQGSGFKGGEDFRGVELFWDRAGGQLLETVDGPRFSIRLKVPTDAPSASHNVVATQHRKDGKLVSQTSIAFFVVPPRR